jgi:hypothetical protein
MPTFTAGIEVQGPIEFGAPCINFRRNLASPSPAFAVGSPIYFTVPVANYKRHLLAAEASVDVRGPIAFADGFVRLPRVRGVFSPSALIDLIIAPGTSGDNTLEIVYDIPGRLRIRPHLIAPPNGSQNRLGSPVLIWTETSEAAYYEVHVARDIDFTQRVFRLNVLGGQAQAGVPFGGTYYWRVRAVAGAKYSDYSEVWSFTVPGLLPVEVGTHDPDGRGRLLTQFKENE